MKNAGLTVATIGAIASGMNSSLYPVTHQGASNARASGSSFARTSKGFFDVHRGENQRQRRKRARHAR